MRCAESLRMQAYFDGELDAPAAADIERHREHCVECRELLRDMEQVRVALRQDVSYESTPAQLRSRVMRLLDEELAASKPRPAAVRLANRRPFWLGAFSGMAGTGIAAGVAFFLLMPVMNNLVVDDLVNSHVRSLMAAHLIDVASTDRHTVKPWFAGHTDVSPAVADFEQQGYKLIGGRADYFDHQRAAVVVYQHGAHVINVFSWADRSAVPRNSTRNGYHLAFWKVGNLTYCAVSDAGWDELLGLETLLQELSARDT